MSEPLLAARDLEREYRVGPETVRVLRGASLVVNSAESVALIGASGVGKSTLLHLLGGLDHPTGGQVFFAGEDLYAIELGWPASGGTVIQTLGTAVGRQTIESVVLLGSDAKLRFRQQSDGLHIQLPAHAASKYAYAFRVVFGNAAQ